MMGVSKNRGTPKWMMNIMVPNPIFLMDDLGVFPYFRWGYHYFRKHPYDLFFFELQDDQGWS